MQRGGETGAVWVLGTEGSPECACACQVAPAAAAPPQLCRHAPHPTPACRRAYHKPLLLFLLTEAAARAAQLLLLLMGFRPAWQGRFTYWHAPPLAGSAAAGGGADKAAGEGPLSPLSPRPLSPLSPASRLRRRSTAGEAVGAAVHHAADAVHHAAEHALHDILTVTSAAAAAVAAQHPHGPPPLSPRALTSPPGVPLPGSAPAAGASTRGLPGPW